MNDQRCCTRRDALRFAFGGAGSLLAAGLLHELCAADEARQASADPLAPKAPHFPAKAKRVIFLFHTGGVSHVDSFDPKPKLFADHGKTVAIDEWQGKPGKYTRYLKKPQWAFKPYGKCGTEVSDLFPHVGGRVDDICMIRSLRSDHTNHYEATLMMHTGSITFARPSIGAWVSYGLGTVNRNLPSFLVLAPAVPYAGDQTWGADFLPGCHQGTRVIAGADADRRPRPPHGLRGSAKSGTRPAPAVQPATPRTPARRRRAGGARAVVRDGLRDAAGGAGGVRPVEGVGRDVATLRPATRQQHRASRGSASSPGGWRNAASVSSN